MLPPAAAVEVVATVAGDGSIRTRSFSIAEPSRVLSLVDGCCGEEQASSSTKERPALVRVGSTSDSEEDSSSDGDENVSSSSKSSSSSNQKKAVGDSLATEDTTVRTVATTDGRTMQGAYDCLSDQITNMFCSAEHLCLQQPPTLPLKSSSGGENPPLTSSVACTETGCTEYQLKDFLNTDGADVFSSLQFWLTPSQEEKTSRGERQTPHNRSSASRKRRSKHVETIWDSWHAEQSIPLERSKSLPSDLRPPSLASRGEVAYVSNDVCYDSDPEQEHSQRTTRGERLRTPRAAKTNTFRDCRPVAIGTIQEDESCFLGTSQVPQAPRSASSTPKEFNFHPKHRKRSTSPSGEPRRRLGNTPRPPSVGPSEHDLMRPEGENLLRSFIQEATNTKIPLIWHRRTHGEAVKRKAPLSVSCAFEVGAHLDTLVVQPKFTWSPTYEPHLPRRKIQLSGTEPDSIELLSIIRVVKPTHLNRNLYPFARLDRTCCITTNDEDFPYLVFEAPSARERDWLVNALKMIVARLASIIIVRDEAMLLEFFTPYAALMHLNDDAHSSSSQHHMQEEHTMETAATSPKPPLDSNGDLQLVSYGRN